MLILAGKLEYIDPETQRQLLIASEEIGKMLSSFITKLSAKDY